MRSTKPFMEHHTLQISTLSPVHMGSGEDYDPTNYVLDDEMLFGFETADLASSVLTSKEKEELSKLVEAPRALLSIQSFIYKLRDRIAGIASHTVSVSAAVSDKYLSRVGKVAQNEGSGQKIINALEISRTAFNLHDQLPLLPGSGLKGSFRTAVLNQLNAGKQRNISKTGKIKMPEAKNLENELFGESFQDDPMRLLKISDAAWHAVDGNPTARVVFDTNLPKDKNRLGNELKSAGLSVMREVIPAMISRGFSAQMNLQHISSSHSKGIPNRQIDLQYLIKACNDYYLAFFKTELKTLEALDCLDQSWLALIRDIFSHELQSLISANKAILLRVGRHTSAEGITIDGARSIEIPQRKDDPSRYGNKTATTLWLAGELSKTKKNLQPFGWVLVEIDPDPNDKISQSLAAKLLNFNRAVWEKQCATRQSIEAKRAEMEYLQTEELAKQELLQLKNEEEARQEAVRQAALAAMSEQARSVENLRKRMASGEGKGKGAGALLAGDTGNLADQSESWSAEDRAGLAVFLPELAAHLGFDIKKNDKWKTRLRALQQASQ